MSFFLLPSEFETNVTAEQNRIWIEQRFHDDSVQTIELTVRQFQVIVGYSQEIIEKSLGKKLNEL
jgi:hypothetical protein